MRVHTFLVVLLGGLLASSCVFGADSSARDSSRRQGRRNTATDNWLGGPGFWSYPYHWSNGVPAEDSSVFVGTGDDYVSLDVNSNVSSVWLGGTTGNSTLDDTLGQDLRIQDFLTLSSSGNLYLGNGAKLTATDIFNSGNLSVYTARDHLSADTFTNFQGANFDIAFGHGAAGTLTNHGTVSVHNGAAALNISSDFTNFATTNIVMRGQLNVAGMLSNELGSTIAVTGQGASVNAHKLINYGGFTQNWGNIATPLLVNAGNIQADHLSTIQVGSGKPDGPGFYQFADGTMVEVVGANYFGSVTVDGPAMLDGELEIFLDNGFIPLVGSTYRFLNFAPGGLAGSFASIEDPYFNGGLEMWQIEYDNVQGFVELVAVASPEPGTLLFLGSGIAAILGRLRSRTA